MGHKIFVSYKYADDCVCTLPNKCWKFELTTVRDYVDELEKLFDRTNDIYKGESDGEDLSHLSDETIKAKLKDRIYDSSVTIVLISPYMKETYRRERDQWIPWEISYSLCETTRHDRTSHNNAIVAVVLPDRNGSYGYYQWMDHFTILKKNIENKYIELVDWCNFKLNPQKYIRNAEQRKQMVPDYMLVKRV